MQASPARSGSFSPSDLSRQAKKEQDPGGGGSLFGDGVERTRAGPDNDGSLSAESEAAGPRGARAEVRSAPPSISDISSLYNAGRVSPFRDYFSGLAETIDPSSGSLILKQRDFVLPGRNGLDLVIERAYVSQAANIYTPQVNVDGTLMSGSGSYDYSYSKQYPGYVGYYYLTFSYSNQPVSSDGTVYGSITGRCDWYEILGDGTEIYSHTEYINTSGWKEPDPSTTYAAYHMYGTTTSPTHLVKVHGLGPGWSFGFPSIEFAPNGSKFLHMGDGTVYKVNFATVSHLDKYPLKDMVFDNDSGTYNNGQMSSAHVLAFKDGRKTYFSSSGWVLGIRDRYGNEIRFTYVAPPNDLRICSIMDSVGRVVAFDYSVSGQVRVSTGGKTWIYNLAPIGSPGTGSKLVSVTDPANRTAAYTYEVRGASFRGSSDWVSPPDTISVDPGTNYYLDLVQVTHPTQGTTRFVYAEAHRDLDQDDPAVDNSSDLTYFRIAERADHLDAGTAASRSQFAYSSYSSATQTYGTMRQEITDISDASAEPAREEWTYSRDHLLKTHKVGNIAMAEAVERSYEYFESKVPSVETTKLTKGTAVRTSTVNYNWDIFRNLMVRSDSLGRRTEFEYDLTYHLPVHKNEFLETVNSVDYYRRTSYTLDDAKRNVTKETAFVGYYGEGPLVTYTGPTSPSMYTGGEWIWTPGKRIHSATIKTSWFAAWPGQPVDYTVYYRPVGTTTWTAYANHHHGSYWWGSAWGTCTFNISLSPGYYEFRVYVGYTGAFGSSVRVSSAQATGRELIWLPRGITSTTEYGYSTSYPGNMTSVTFRHPDGSTETTGFTYDSQYNAYPVTSTTTVQKADGSTSTITTFASYDSFGRMTEYGTRDQTSSTSNRYTYDSVGRLVAAAYPAVGGVVSSKTWTYDDPGRTVTVRDENQNTLTEAYDPLGRFIELRRPLGGVTKPVERAFYNSLGGLSAVEDAEGHRTSYDYDAFRRKTRVTYADGAANAFEYGVLASDPDGVARYEKATDSNGNWTRRGYDVAGRLVKVEELIAQSPETIAITRYQYDLLNRVTQVTDAKGQVTVYGYDLWDSPTSADLPGTTEPVHTYAYDARGRKISEDAGDSTLYTQYRYDALGRLIKTIYPTGQQAWFFHDKDGRATEARLHRLDGTQESTTQAAYDPRGRRTSESWTVGGVTYTISYSYDPVGNMTGMTYPDGASYQFAYDDWNRLVAIPGLFGQSEFSPGFRYRDTGFLERMERANGIAATITPDVRLRPVGIQDTALSLSYTYDGEGNVRSQNGLLYGYDGLDRLTSAQVPGAAGGVRTVAYTYDKVGNRLSEVWDGGTPKSYTYNTGNYLASAGGTAYSYGKFGELRQKQASGTTTEYIYDGARRMVQVKAGGTETARYVYDAFGRRISATAGGVTSITLYLGNDIVYRREGDVATRHVVAGGKYLAKVVAYVGSGTPPDPQEQYGTFFFHTDIVGSIRAVTNSSGQVVARYDYEPFGLTVRAEGVLAGQNVHKFTGKPEDTGTGLYYFGARYYDPVVGRFISQDPARQGSNWYVYAENNPIKYVDPNGETSITASIYLHRYSHMIVALEAKYGLPPSILASVVWNENKYRNVAHFTKDVAGLCLWGRACLGICQVQMTTAAFLDTDPDPSTLQGITNQAFESRKREAFSALSPQDRLALALKLHNDDVASLEYAAKYLALIKQATGIDDPQVLLANYNRGPESWHNKPNDYGKAHREHMSLWARLRLWWTNLFTPAVNDFD